jgi:hypothetical protein
MVLNISVKANLCSIINMISNYIIES